MKKTTQKEIRWYIRNGMATQIEKPGEVKGNLEVIAMSFGVYGMNGALLQDKDSGERYAIPSRNTALFYYV